MATRELPPNHNRGLPTLGGWLCASLLVLAFVLCIVGAVWLARRHGPTDDSPQPLPGLTQTDANEPAPKAKDELPRPFLAQHCQSCHTGDKPKGKFHLQTLTQDFSDKANRERWLAVAEQVESGAMPPKTKPRPPENDSIASLTD